MKANTYLIINRYLKSRTSDRRPYVILACERGSALRKNTKPRVDDEEEEVPIKSGGLTGQKNSYVPPHNILKFSREQNVGCAVSAQKIYNVVAKIKKNRMQGQNTVEEVLCLSAQRDYTVFYRNTEDNNVLSDIVVAHPTSIAMIKTWSYVLIMDTTYKTNKYNILLLEAIGMTPTGKNFTVATAFMRNEYATTYRWTTNIAESEHSVLKLWLSTCHGDFDTMFLNIDYLIEGQISEIKTSLEISKLKEKYGAKSNPILKNIKIGVDISTVHERDINFKMHDLTSMLEEISTSLISKVREVHRLIKGVTSPVLLDDPCAPLTTPSPQNRSQEGMTEDKFNQKGLSLTGNTQAVQGPDREPGPFLGLVLVHVEEVDRQVFSSVVNTDTPSTPFSYIDAFPSFMPATTIAGPMAISSRYTSQWLGRTLL
ncbi:hypothetical protein M9H77_28249 [Catharanthus roseus]|uniref:Uncharacterized protein n=1 Tax=Catharanthus roseus TaxID=4058 RepID=A0ACC0AFF8_CATRO|nr:hypothetical protein M9H77_28249 [Catharanthus roseus]